MLQKTLRRCIAASTMGIVAGLTIPIASAASFVEIKLHDAIDLDSESDTYLQPIQADVLYGLPYGTELHVEWWEWDTSTDRAYVNQNCSFFIAVDEIGIFSKTSDVVYEAESDGHTFRHQSGCSPAKVGQDNSFVRVYPSADSQLVRPAMVMEVIVDSGSNKKRVGPFRSAMESQRGSTQPWSLTDACEIREFASDFDPETQSYSDNKFVALNANVNPEVLENNQDVSSDGGMLVFPSRAASDTVAWVICDAGYIPDASARFPDPDATFSTEPLMHFEALPNVGQTRDNEAGQGLKNSALRSADRVSALANSDVLSVLSYNIQVGPRTPESDAQFAQCAAALVSNIGVGSACNLERGKRKRIVREVAESIRASQPDVIVLTEMQQDAVSGFGFNNWEEETVRDEMLNELQDLYAFANFSPSNSPSVSGNPLNCPSAASDVELSPDVSVYPDQTSAHMVHDTYCSDPSGGALDSGVLIGVLTQVATIEAQAFHRFEAAKRPDLAMSKGVKYAKVRKGSQDYHIFGSHIQSSRKSCAARIGQWREVADFVVSQTAGATDSSERIVFTGDLNADPVRNNQFRKDPDELGLTCRNDLEYLTQRLRTQIAFEPARPTVGLVKLSPNSMPFSNDCLLNELVETENDNCFTPQRVGDKSKILDHAIWMGEKPTRSGAVIFRQTADGDNNGFKVGEDFSGHYPMVSVLDYRTSVSDQSLSAYYDYGASGLSSFALNRPSACPYGTLADHKTIGTDFIANPNGNAGKAEPELICLPVICEGSLNSAPGDSCNPATYAEPVDGVRNTCRESDDNFAAPCSVPAGYENLAKLETATFTASSELDANTTAANLIADGKFFVEGDADPVGQTRSWISASSGHGPHWVKATFPLAQYVKRVRFWNLPGAYGTVSYELSYTDANGVERPFGDGALYDAARDPSDTYDSNGQELAQSTIAWSVVDVTHPVAATAITLTCQGQTPGQCGVSELEIYGGPE
nr:hypothetical protein [Hyphomonas sp. Mor2]